MAPCMDGWVDLRLVGWWLQIRWNITRELTKKSVYQIVVLILSHWQLALAFWRGFPQQAIFRVPRLEIKVHPQTRSRSIQWSYRKTYRLIVWLFLQMLWLKFTKVLLSVRRFWTVFSFTISPFRVDGFEPYPKYEQPREPCKATKRCAKCCRCGVWQDNNMNPSPDVFTRLFRLTSSWSRRNDDCKDCKENYRSKGVVWEWLEKLSIFDE